MTTTTTTTMTDDEAPSSPRSAALYYWGGNNNNNNNNNNNTFYGKIYEDEKQEEVVDRFYWEEVTPSTTASPLWKSRNCHAPSGRRWNRNGKTGNDRNDTGGVIGSIIKERGSWVGDDAEAEAKAEEGRVDSIWNTSQKYRRRVQVRQRRRIRFHLSIDDDDDDEEEKGVHGRSNARWLLVNPVPAPKEEEKREERKFERGGEEVEVEKEEVEEDEDEGVDRVATSSSVTAAASAAPAAVTANRKTDSALLPEDDFAPPSEIHRAGFHAGKTISTDININNNINNDANSSSSNNNRNGNEQDDNEQDGNEQDVDDTPPTADDFTALPIIDLSLPPSVYAHRIGEACRATGFFYVINHGIDVETSRAVMDASAAFFDLDVDDKWKVRAGRGDGENDGASKGYRGYFGIGMEDLENKDGTRDLISEEGSTNAVDGDDIASNTGAEIEGDFKEGFDCGLETYDTANHAEKEGINEQNDECIKFFGKNLWPDEARHPSLRGFRNTLLRYQTKVLGLADKLLIAFAKSLNEHATNHPPDDDEIRLVPEDYFVSRSTRPMCTLRLLHYPPNLHSSSNGCGAHTDYGLFTILLQDSIGGLQVRNRSNAWIDAPPVPGSFVINVGDMLSHWTGGEYASTVHRVISPTGGSETDGDDDIDEMTIRGGGNETTPKKKRGGGSGKHRYSIPFFFNPSHDAVVKPILGSGGSSGLDAKGTTAAAGSENTYKRAVDVLRERYEGTFQKKSKDESS